MARPTPTPPRSKSRIKTFWCEQSARAREQLRRFTYVRDNPCGSTGRGHDAIATIGEVDFPLSNGLSGDGTLMYDRADPRWPKSCTACGYEFTPDDQWQHSLDRLYRRVDTGEMLAHEQLPAGASYDCPWVRDFGYVGSDNIALTVVLPDGTHWHVDSEANNCTRKGDRSHKCWVRDGDPRACNVTAGKQGNTCSAGAGSIQSPGYHGFLRNGWLEEC